MFTADAYFTALTALPNSTEFADVTERVFAQVFRRNFTAPGVALLSLRKTVGSVELRSFMIALKEALSERYQRVTGRRLGYLSMGRFNQQTTTRFHLDGAPDEAYLMLGYEPSTVASELSIADYTKAAHDWEMTPKSLLAHRNPMYGDHERQLLPYATRLEGFDPSVSQVVLLNNSSFPFGTDGTLGVMHKAVIPQPRPEQDRVVNSTMIVPLAVSDEAVSPESQRSFLETMPEAR